MNNTIKKEIGPHGIAYPNEQGEILPYTTGMIYQKLADIMKDIKPIGKDNVNTFGEFRFRSIDDIYNQLHPLFAKHEVFIIVNLRDVQTSSVQRKDKDDIQYTTLFIDYKLYTVDGSYVSGFVAAKDTGDKVFGKCMSYALKYFLTEMFLIPTGDVDPDADRPIEPQVPSQQPTQTQKETKSNFTDQPNTQKTEQKTTQYKTISDGQVRFMWVKCKNKDLTPDKVAKYFGYTSAINIPADKKIFDPILAYMDNHPIAENKEQEDVPF